VLNEVEGIYSRGGWEDTTDTTREGKTVIMSIGDKK